MKRYLCGQRLLGWLLIQYPFKNLKTKIWQNNQASRRIGIYSFKNQNSKSNGPYFRPSKSSQDPVVVTKFEFCPHSTRLQRKLDHFFLWILSIICTGLWQCSIEKKKSKRRAMFCLYNLPLARPDQAKIKSNIDNF